MKGLSAFIKIELKSLLREPVTIFFMIVLPLILTVVFGSAFGDSPIKEGSDIYGIDTVIPINIVFLLANAGLMGIPITISEARDQHALKRYFTLPISYSSYFLALMTTFAIVSLISMAVFMAASFLVYSAGYRMNVLNLILFIASVLLVLYVFFISGYLLAILIKTSRTTNVVSTILFLALIFSSGVAIPLDTLPHWIQQSANLLPMSHSVLVLQDLWTNTIQYEERLGDFIYLIAVALLSALLVNRIRLKWDH